MVFLGEGEREADDSVLLVVPDSDEEVELLDDESDEPVELPEEELDVDSWRFRATFSLTSFSTVFSSTIVAKYLKGKNATLTKFI